MGLAQPVFIRYLDRKGNNMSGSSSQGGFQQSNPYQQNYGMQGYGFPYQQNYGMQQPRFGLGQFYGNQQYDMQMPWMQQFRQQQYPNPALPQQNWNNPAPSPVQNTQRSFNSNGTVITGADGRLQFAPIPGQGGGG